MNAHEIVALEKLRLGLQVVLSDEMLETAVDVAYHPTLQGAVASIRGFVWAEAKSAQRQEVKYPADWWQAFKERWFPKWLLKRYPVDYRIVVLDVRAIYPTFKAALPNHEYRLFIQRQ